ncbi:hypothetical protein AALO_G00213140 [Alosa alosa]|uniref:Chemokine interleukin-8-like domain-containing protein n=1 Tax=Alosa alosa TaxID=278164 RepID=A0AAV6G059_9TELE|nr:hypothetical protein AALO_G00213140 [Alosa alosa]
MALHQMVSLFCVLTLLSSCIQGGTDKSNPDPKPVSCCTAVSPVCSLNREKINRCVISSECVPAVIFFVGKEACCVPKRAKWVRNVIKELKKKGKPCKDESKPIPNAMRIKGYPQLQPIRPADITILHFT